MTWWENGVQFACQGSGRCCTSRGEYGFVFLSLSDRRRLASHLKMPTSSFTRKYCQKYNGAFHLKEDGINPDCLFLKGHRCGVYEARPEQCRTWPFWPEVMNAKTWKKEVMSFCPGIGKGRIVPAQEIKRQLAQQTKAEVEILAESQKSR